MITLSNELRHRKESKYEEQDAFNRWVEEYAFIHEMSIKDVLNLAIFREEHMAYTGKEIR